MRTLKQIIDKVHAEGRTGLDLTKRETIDAIGAIAQDIMVGKTTIMHGNVLEQIRFSMMSDSERDADYKQTEGELSQIAASLGEKGGKAKSDAKTKSSRENGKKGGRPKGSGKKKEGQ